MVRGHYRGPRGAILSPVNCFFDSSALVKLYHPELGSQRVVTMFGAQDRRIIVSRLAGVELHSALALKTRTGSIDGESCAAVLVRFYQDVASGLIALVAVAESHYPAAERLILQYGEKHGLRTLDALHLAVALDVRERVGIGVLVASDKVLCEVAALAGFVVLNPERP